MRLFPIALLLSLANASSLLNASLSLQDAFVDLLPIPKPPSVLQDPTRRLITYVQTFTDTAGAPLSLLPLLEHNTRTTHVILGALHLHDTPGRIMLNNDPLDAEIYDAVWREVKVLQENGVRVLGLLGGAAPGTYKRLSGNDTQFEAYYRPLLRLVKKYRLDGLDVDIEERISLTSAVRLLTRLRADMGPNFLITMAPLATALLTEDGDNVSGFSYFDLERLAGTSQANDSSTATPLVNWYNAQFYGGYARSAWLYDSIVAAGFAPERLVMGVTTSAAGYPNGFTALKKLTKVIRGIRETYEDRFGGVSAWEYWDAGSNDSDMGMRVGGEPWRWMQRVAKVVFGESEIVRGRRAAHTDGERKWAECLKICASSGP